MCMVRFSFCGSVEPMCLSVNDRIAYPEQKGYTCAGNSQYLYHDAYPLQFTQVWIVDQPEAVHVGDQDGATKDVRPHRGRCTP